MGKASKRSWRLHWVRSNDCAAGHSAREAASKGKTMADDYTVTVTLNNGFEYTKNANTETEARRIAAGVLQEGLGIAESPFRRRYYPVSRIVVVMIAGPSFEDLVFEFPDSPDVFKIVTTRRTP